MPFSSEEFLKVFGYYNLAVWPMQILLYLLGILSILLLFRNKRSSGKVILLILAFLWGWTGIVYHLSFFSRINPAAFIFGGVFTLQGCIFLWKAFGNPPPPQFKFPSGIRGIAGLLFLFYAMVLYPVLAVYFGHRYPQVATFGLPCPTVIYTFGILLFSVKRPAWYIFTIPFLWSLVGFSAAVHLGIWEDLGLVAAGLLGTLLLLFSFPRSASRAR